MKTPAKTQQNATTKRTQSRTTSPKNGRAKKNGAATAVKEQVKKVEAEKVQAEEIQTPPIEEVVAEEITVDPKIKENFKIFDEFFDAGYAMSITKRVMSKLNKYYFRARFVNFENFPERNNPDRPLIFASNHSGMAFPWDAIVFASGLLEQNDYDLSKCVRTVAAPMLSKAHFMSPFLIKNFWRRLGAIDATRLNFETMMYYDEANVMIYPEGVPGIGKGFNNRYHLQKLSTSSLRLSLKYKTDIVPFATVNGEFINPLSYSLSVLNDLVQKMGIPFLPIGPMTLLIPLQPWLFYFALPAKLTYVLGERIKPYEMIQKNYEDITEDEIHALRDKIHMEMQVGLNLAVAKYGKEPYAFKELFTTVFNNLDKIFSFIPFAWPALFVEHEKQYKRLKALLAQEENQPKSAKEKADRVKEIHDAEEEKEIGFMDVVDTVIQNPEILLLYTPVVGLFSMFLDKPQEGGDDIIH